MVSFTPSKTSLPGADVLPRKPQQNPDYASPVNAINVHKPGKYNIKITCSEWRLHKMLLYDTPHITVHSCDPTIIKQPGYAEKPQNSPHPLGNCTMCFHCHSWENGAERAIPSIPLACLALKNWGIHLRKRPKDTTMNFMWHLQYASSCICSVQLAEN